MSDKLPFPFGKITNGTYFTKNRTPGFCWHTKNMDLVWKLD